MGAVLIRNPGDSGWQLAELPLEVDGDFGVVALQAMAGGLFGFVPVGHGLALVFDENGMDKGLPFCMAFGTRDGPLIPFVGPVTVVRLTSTRMRPVRDVEVDTLLRHFVWAVA